MMRKKVHIRAVAWVFVAFYAVAAVRALVPEICATLAPMENEVAVACCDTDGHSDTRLTAGESQHADCALCNLTESTSNTFTEVIAIEGAPYVARAMASYESPRGSPSHWSPLSHRGPPTAA